MRDRSSACKLGHILLSLEYKEVANVKPRKEGAAETECMLACTEEGFFRRRGKEQRWW